MISCCNPFDNHQALGVMGESKGTRSFPVLRSLTAMSMQRLSEEHGPSRFYPEVHLATNSGWRALSLLYLGLPAWSLSQIMRRSPTADLVISFTFESRGILDGDLDETAHKELARALKEGEYPPVDIELV